MSTENTRPMIAEAGCDDCSAEPGEAHHEACPKVRQPVHWDGDGCDDLCRPTGVGGPDHCGLCGRRFDPEEEPGESALPPSLVPRERLAELRQLATEILGAIRVGEPVDQKRIDRWYERLNRSGNG